MKISVLHLLIAVAIVWPSVISRASIPTFEDFEYAGDGVITIYNTHSHELETVQYKNEDGYMNEGLNEINYLLRCRMNDEKAQMSLKLITLIDHIQDHFGVSKIDIISAYRSPEFNRSLRKRGHRAAKESLHMKGLAVDMVVPGVPMRKLRDYAKSLKMGGVGYYKRFVHVDVGPVRYW